MEKHSFNGNKKTDVGYEHCQTGYDGSYIDPQMQQILSPNYAPYLTIVEQPLYYPQQYPIYHQESFAANDQLVTNHDHHFDTYTNNIASENMQNNASNQALQEFPKEQNLEAFGYEEESRSFYDNGLQSHEKNCNRPKGFYNRPKVSNSANSSHNSQPNSDRSSSRHGSSRGRFVYNNHNRQNFRHPNSVIEGRAEGSFRRNSGNWSRNNYRGRGNHEKMENRYQNYGPQQASFNAYTYQCGPSLQKNYPDDRVNNYQNSKRGHSTNGYHNTFPRNRQSNRQYYNSMDANSFTRKSKPFKKGQNSLSSKDYPSKQTEVNDKKSVNSKMHPKPAVSYSETDEKLHKDRLVELLTQGTYECMVCCEYIKQQQQIWSCNMCYHCFHLACTKKWAQTSHEEQGWRCPACQNITPKVPNIYFCFCRKMRNPEWNRREVPHSCGEICSKKRGSEWCTHKCNVLCHPGPCPPCSAFMIRYCPCGKSSKSLRCSQSEVYLCSKLCLKLLNCKKHTCDKSCHEGNCDPCNHQLNKNCYCGKEEKSVCCTEKELAEESFSCKGTCSKKLNCDNHFCENVCHNGPCDPCDKALDTVITCPCTKVLLIDLYKDEEIVPRSSCTDPIPTCGETCGKQLKCGTPGSFHRCQSKCHEGPCPPCPLDTDVRCRCGSKDCKVPCIELSAKADEVLCEKQCKKLRQCGRHKCGTKCCIDQDHTCPRICGKTLKCKLHKCEELCHRGNCPRCWQTSFDELTCHCGAEVMFPPIPCGTEPPACDKPCQRTQACNHPVAHTCHSDDNCPPCTQLVSKKCFGGHVVMKITPCYVKAISCGEICDKKLSCSNHKCQKVCHDGPCQKGNKCGQKCSKARSTCEHMCGNPCHAGQCPNTACKVYVTVSCSCGNRKVVLVCSENEREYRAMATSRLASMMQHNINSGGGSVDISQMFSGASKSEKFNRLECNDDCLLIARNQRLALALQITNPETRERLGDQNAMFSDSLKDDAKKDIQFCTMIHNALHDLVMKARDSKQKSRSHSFPPMNKEKRRFIHEYSKHFGCTSQAYDEEPKKNVVVTATKGMCYLPPFTVMEVVQKEQGKRKVPGPVLNRKSNLRDEVVPQLQKLEKKNGNSKSGAGGTSTPPTPIDYFDME